MSKFINILVVGALLTGTPSVSIAQPTGSRIDNTRMVEASVSGWHYGRCLADYKPEASEALLIAAPNSAESAAAVRQLVNRNYDRCYTEAEFGGQEMHLIEPLMRGHVAQGRYRLKYPQAAPAQIADAAPSEISVEVYNLRISTAADQQAEILRIFGDCVVAAAPGRVDSLIRTGVTSDEEAQAIGDLGEFFGPCLWQSQSIAFSAESLRAVLAEALYRRSEGRTVMALEGTEAPE